MMDHSLQTFFPMFEKRGGAWYAWLFLQGIQEEADRFVTSKSKIVNTCCFSVDGFVANNYDVTFQIILDVKRIQFLYISCRWEGVVRVRDPTRKSLLEFRGPVFPIDVTGQEVRMFPFLLSE